MHFHFSFRTLDQVYKVKSSSTCASTTDFASHAHSTSTVYLSPLSSSSTITLRSIKTLNSLAKNVIANTEAKRIRRLGSQTQFESIDEDSEVLLPKTDSGVVSQSSKRSASTKDIRYLTKTNSTSTILEKLSEHPQSNQTQMRCLPKTVSFLAGVFLFKIFETKRTDSSQQAAQEFEEFDKPLISCTISQPSFMVTQNIYDSVVNFSIFNLSAYLATTDEAQIQMATNLFPKNIIDTMPGELTSTGIPPSLLTYRLHNTKLKMREIDIELAKALVVTISEQNVAELGKHLMIIYNSINTRRGMSFAYEGSLHRKSKILLMKSNTLNADRLNFKCNHVALKLTDYNQYECKLVFCDLKLNLKYLSRPEKCSAKFSLASTYLRTNKKVFLHPVALKASIDFVSEPWNRLPLINAIVKFNVIQIDLGIYVILRLRQAVEDLKSIASCAQKELQRFQRLHLHDHQQDTSVALKQLVELKCPRKRSFIQNNKNFKREEFYQDDLR